MSKDQKKIIFIAGAVIAGLLAGAYYMPKGQSFGSTVEVLPPFRQSGNQILPRDTDADLFIGGTTSSSAKFAADGGNGSVRLNGVTYTWPSADGSSNQRLTTNGSGALSWATVSGGGGGGGGSAIGFNEFGGSFTNVTSVSFDAGGFNVSFPAQALVKLDYVNGPASRSIAQTISGQWAFTSSPLGLTISNSASISKNLEIGGYASVSGTVKSFRANGADTFFEGWRRGEAFARTYLDGFGSLFFGGSGTATAPHKLAKDSGNAAYLNYTNTTASASIFIIDQADTALTNSESTLTLRRTVPAGSEFIDYFNNGYYTNGDLDYGQLIQKTGTADYHPWIFGYYDQADTAPSNQITDAEIFLYATPSFPVGATFSRTRGELGIRTKRPSAWLTLAGGIGGTTASTSQLKFLNSTALLTTPENGTLQYFNNRFYIDGNDGLSVSKGASFSAGVEASIYASASKIYAQSGTLSLPGFTFTGDTDTGIYRAGSNAIGIVGGGSAIQYNGSSLFPENDATRNLGLSTNRWLGLFSSNASVSAGFEVLGTASVSGAFTQNSVASNSFLGSLSGATTGTLSVGTSNNPLKILWANIVRAVNQFFFPTGDSTKTTASGEGFANTSSDSLEYNAGGQSRSTGKCDRTPTYILKGTDLTGKNQWSILYGRDPFRLIDFAVKASGSNSLSWNLLTGSGTVPTTKVFTNDKQASGSAWVKYTNFTGTASISDGQSLDIVVSSTSAALDSVTITGCLQYDTTE